jgi:hypothetical protein
MEWNRRCAVVDRFDEIAARLADRVPDLHDQELVTVATIPTEGGTLSVREFGPCLPTCARCAWVATIAESLRDAYYCGIRDEYAARENAEREAAGGMSR